MSSCGRRRSSRAHRGLDGYWHGVPLHMQPPDEQSVNEQFAPGAQAIRQLPEEQLTLQVAPAGHDVLQCPLEHSTVHGPLPQ